MRIRYNCPSLGTALKWAVDTTVSLMGVPVPITDILGQFSVDATKEIGCISGKFRLLIQESINNGLEQYRVACQVYDEMDWRVKHFLDYHAEYAKNRKSRMDWADTLFQRPIKNIRRIRALRKINTAADKQLLCDHMIPVIGFFLKNLPRCRLNILLSRMNMYIGRQYGIGVLCAIRNKHLNACNGNPMRLFSLAVQDIVDDYKIALIESNKKRRTVYSFAVCDISYDGEGKSLSMKVQYEIAIPRVLRKSIETWRRSVRNSIITGARPVLESPILFYIHIPRKYISKGYPDGGEIEWYSEREIHREMEKDDNTAKQ